MWARFDQALEKLRDRRKSEWRRMATATWQLPHQMTQAETELLRALREL